MLLKANPGSTRVIMESNKNRFGCYLREKNQLHGEVVWLLEEVFLEGCRVVGLESGRKIRSEGEGQSFGLVIFGREKEKEGLVWRGEERREIYRRGRWQKNQGGGVEIFFSLERLLVKGKIACGLRGFF